MKQTAVEFAFEELNNWRIKNLGEHAIIGIPNEVVQKAKEMEKEQLIDFARECLNKAKDLDILTAFMNVEQYYTKIFKSE
jgi:hypothetical protein